MVSDRLNPLSLRKLLSWIMQDVKQGEIFGIPETLFFRPSLDDPFRMTRYGQSLQTPIGVAAGPHTQLSQNLIISWLCGARYLELKTVQTLDELEVSKPCIDMQDEGYNCEWSQELKLRQSLDEYLNAWIIIHILQDHLGWGDSPGAGAIFNMSVGYNLEGILNENVQEFIKFMMDSSELLMPKLESIRDLYPRLADLQIPTKITDNVTLSTMHGCPPDEIEKIAQYLLTEKKLHTAVKLNPTLLGPARLRDILNTTLGYGDVHVPDLAFEHDLVFSDAIQLIENLQRTADQEGLDFGLKLTNTLEVENHRPVFPSSEKMMYLSGRALHPISINLAHKLQLQFDGELDLSFSAGADAFNVADTLSCNLRPITTCTDVLKPGGYTRLKQYLNNLKEEFSLQEASSIDEYITIKAGKDSLVEAGMKNLASYAKQVLEEKRYHKHSHHFDSIKTERSLEAFDCIQAPCIDACATGQDVPEYLYQTMQGNFEQALRVIRDTNPLPGVTGHVCDHLCQLKCTRNNYDDPLLIREIKRFNVEYAELADPARKEIYQEKVAVIGAGPAGLSCAYFLAKAGITVEIFEAKPFSGGMVSDAIPAFRLPDELIELDLGVLEALGVSIHYEQNVNRETFQELRKQYEAVFIGVGAQDSISLELPGEPSPSVLDPLAFLSDVRKGKTADLGDNILIIGGGNTAMDAARTALRISSENASIQIIYRRTRSEMPADIDEIDAALSEGIKLHELVAPLELVQGNSGQVLRCQRMKLGAADDSGRRRPVPIDDAWMEFDADTIIPAIGQRLHVDFMDEEPLQLDPATGETQFAGIYAGGDAIRGASSVINAIGDGQQAATSILKALSIDVDSPRRSGERSHTLTDLKVKAGERLYAIDVPQTNRVDITTQIHGTLTAEEAMTEASRCLFCDEYCSVCVGVCPNLAMMTYEVVPAKYAVHTVENRGGEITIQQSGVVNVDQKPQVLNINDFCNECGNCTTFCPTAGEPFLDKPRLCLSEAAYGDLERAYFFSDGVLHYKDSGIDHTLSEKEHYFLCQTAAYKLELSKTDLSVHNVELYDEETIFSTETAIHMVVLMNHLQAQPLFRDLI